MDASYAQTGGVVLELESDMLTIRTPENLSSLNRVRGRSIIMNFLKQVQFANITVSIILCIPLDIIMSYVMQSVLLPRMALDLWGL